MPGDAETTGPSTTAPPPNDPPPPHQPLVERARALLARPGGEPGEFSDDPFGEAVELLRRGMAAEEPDAAEVLARAHLSRGQRHPAVDLLSTLVHEQGRVDLARPLAAACADLGNHEQAEEAYLLGSDAADPAALHDYGLFLRARGRAQEAAWVLDRAARGGDATAVLPLVGLHLDELDDPATATAIAERFAEVHPSGLVALADVRAAAGRLDDAEAWHRRAADRGGDCAHLYYAWFLLDRRDDPVGGEHALRRAVDLGEAGARVALGRFLLDVGRGDEARPLFEHAAFHGDLEAATVLEEEYEGLYDEGDD